MMTTTTLAIHYLALFIILGTRFSAAAHAKQRRPLLCKLTLQQQSDIERKLLLAQDEPASTAAAVQNGGTLTFEDLGIATEQEGLDVCDIILDMFQVPIKAATTPVIPINYGCGCDVLLDDLRIDFTCGVTICADVIGSLLNLAYPGVGVAVSALFHLLPFKDLFCFSPTYTGRLGSTKDGPQMGSELCTGTSHLVVDSTLLSQMTLGTVDVNEDISFGVPNMCLSVTNKRENLLSLESCHARIDGEDILGNTLAGSSPGGMIDCPCEICNEQGTDIRLNCPEVMESMLPGTLRGMFEFSQECMGIGAITKFFTNNDPEESQPRIPLISPVLTMMKPIHANRTVGTVGKWYLVNSVTNKFVQYIQDGETIDQENCGTNHNICVETRGDVASVDFSLNNLHIRHDNSPPYCLGADNAVLGTFEPVPHLNVIGNYVLEATPYLFDGMNRRSGITTTTSIKVMDSTQPSVDSSIGGVLQWNLINAEDNDYVRKLAPSDTITQESFGKSLNICIDTRVTVQSVEFLINGNVVSFDNLRPFCLGGDDARSGTFQPVPELASAGPFMITAVTYGETDRDKGVVGSTESISLTITD